MKKIIILFFIFTLNLFSQSIWVPQTFPGNNGLREVYFLNSQTGWIAGYNGLIYKTTDSGENWISQTSGTIYSIYSVCFINENTGWLGGIFAGSSTRKTTNGGINWIPAGISSGGSAILSEIFFINENTGWNVNSIGQICKTTNMGANWFFEYYAGSELSSLQFIDVNTGWASGAGGKIIKTTNGGNSWFNLNSGTNDFVTDVCFVNNNSGWFVGTVGQIGKTTDGGNSWFLQNSGTGYNFSKCYFTSIHNGWAIGEYGTIRRTTNGGLNWFGENSGINDYLWDITFIGEDLGYITAGNSGPKLLKTTDDGYNPPNEPSEPINLEAVADSSRRINLSWIDNSENEEGFGIERSIDGGNNWSLLFATPQNSVSYPDTGLTPYSVYYYRVYAFNSSGNSPYSNIAWDIAKSYKSCDNIFVLITKINELKNKGVINQGQANSLIVKLNSACEFRNRGQLNAAINQMGAFINQVNAFMNAEIFTSAQGEELIVIAIDIISQLEVGNSPLLNNQHSEEIPTSFLLYQNYPNPFNPISKIRYSVPSGKYQVAKSDFVSLTVFDLTGKEVAVLVNQEQNAGTYEVVFDGTNYPSGVYFYRLTAGEFSETRSMILIK